MLFGKKREEFLARILENIHLLNDIYYRDSTIVIELLTSTSFLLFPFFFF